MSAVRFTGKVKSWNDDRGFGFIAPTDGGQDIFVHISDCPRSIRPELQETLTFEVALNAQGKKKAVNVRHAEIAGNAASRERARVVRGRRSETRSGGVIAGLVALAIAGGVGWYGYQQYGSRLGAAAAGGAPADRNLPLTGAPSASRFSCDGRTYCSQMTSCVEATYFLKNCPGVQMDGNHDGVPCQQQWCR
jgi:cold shock CspA family protein